MAVTPTLSNGTSVASASYKCDYIIAQLFVELQFRLVSLRLVAACSLRAMFTSACFCLVHLSFLRCLAKLEISRLHATLGVCKCVTTRKLSATSPKGFRHFGPV